MGWSHWDVLAKAAADYAQVNLRHLRGGTIHIDIVADSVTVLAHFGATTAVGETALPEVERLRKELVQVGSEELGFGRSANGQTWCVLVVPKDAPSSHATVP